MSLFRNTEKLQFKIGGPQWTIGTSREQEAGTCYYRKRGSGMDRDSQSPSEELGPRARRLPTGGGTAATAATRMKHREIFFLPDSK